VKLFRSAVTGASQPADLAEGRWLIPPYEPAASWMTSDLALPDGVPPATGLFAH